MANVTIGCNINGGLLIGYSNAPNGQPTVPVILAGPAYSTLNKGAVGVGFTTVDQGIYTAFNLANPQFTASGAIWEA
jgi:hypothetical protein